MTSRRLAAANRRNARQSTGPRTAQGKRSVARNAVRHGLRVPVLADPDLANEIVELAERLADGSKNCGHESSQSALPRHRSISNAYVTPVIS